MSFASIVDMYEYPEYVWPTQPAGTVGPAFGAEVGPYPEVTYLDPYGNMIDPITGEMQLATSAVPLLGPGTGVATMGAGGAGLVGKAIPWLAKLFPWIMGAAAGWQIKEELGGLLPGQQYSPSGIPYPQVPGTGIPLVGPGQIEPPAQLVAKEWAGIGGSRFYLLVNGRVVVRKRNGVYKLIKRPRMIHMKASNPRLGDVARASKVIKRVAKAVKKYT